MAEQAKAGLDGLVIAVSKICSIDGEKGELIYYGYNIHDLAQKATFEEVTYLLFNGKLPNRAELKAFSDELKSCREVDESVLKLIKTFPKDTVPMAMLRTVVSYLSTFDAGSEDIDIPSLRTRSLRLTSTFPTIVAAIARHREGKDFVAPRTDLDHAANFLYMINGEVPNELKAKTMDVCLTLHAEHGFNASTFTARVVAATMSDLYSSVTAAIGALKGPLHGGANTEVMHMLLEIGDESKADAFVDAKMEKKEKIMGMGHRVYKTYDPRAKELNKLSLEMGKAVNNTRWLEISERIWKRVNEKKGLWPNVDFFSASTYYTMGIDPELNTLIFAVSRITGWCAHIIEQMSHNRLIRPLCDYDGPMNLPFPAIDDR